MRGYCAGLNGTKISVRYYGIAGCPLLSMFEYNILKSMKIQSRHSELSNISQASVKRGFHCSISGLLFE